ncbi:MAG: NAD(P)H-dependent oxidoreductase [Pseudomonadota bacterium]
MKNVLRIDASMRRDGSRSRQLADALMARFEDVHGRLVTTLRDLADGVPFVDAAWIDANFTDPAERSPEQRAVLAQSDALFSELKAADTLVIATPVYNFGTPAALKAWVDMIVRAKEAFRYTADGPEGLMKGKSAYIVVVSGGTKADSAIDFATPYLRHVLGFIGITDVTVVGSDLGGVSAEDANAAALEAIAALDV